MTGPRRTQSRDAGAYIGRMPERSTETLPAGPRRDDRRVSAVATVPGTVRGPQPGSPDATPQGHREGPDADTHRREAGQDR